MLLLFFSSAVGFIKIFIITGVTIVGLLGVYFYWRPNNDKDEVYTEDNINNYLSEEFPSSTIQFDRSSDFCSDSFGYTASFICKKRYNRNYKKFGIDSYENTTNPPLDDQKSLNNNLRNQKEIENKNDKNDKKNVREDQKLLHQYTKYRNDKRKLINSQNKDPKNIANSEKPHNTDKEISDNRNEEILSSVKFDKSDSSISNGITDSDSLSVKFDTEESNSLHSKENTLNSSDCNKSEDSESLTNEHANCLSNTFDTSNTSNTEDLEWDGYEEKLMFEAKREKIINLDNFLDDSLDVSSDKLLFGNSEESENFYQENKLPDEKSPNPDCYKSNPNDYKICFD